MTLSFLLQLLLFSQSYMGFQCVCVLEPMSRVMCNLYLCCGHTDVSEQSTLYMLRELDSLVI